MGGKQPSSIDRLPDSVKAAIGELRVQGRTIDEILGHLKLLNVDISRSALGRHVKGLASLKERMQHSRDMAIALVGQYGDQPDNKLARLNLELMHSVVMQTITATSPDEDGEPQPITFSPEDAMFLSSALQKLAAAQKTDSDRAIVMRRELAKDAANAAGNEAKARGMSAETVAAIRNAVLGVV